MPQSLQGNRTLDPNRVVFHWTPPGAKTRALIPRLRWKHSAKNEIKLQHSYNSWYVYELMCMVNVNKYYQPWLRGDNFGELLIYTAKCRLYWKVWLIHLKSLPVLFWSKIVCGNSLPRILYARNENVIYHICNLIKKLPLYFLFLSYDFYFIVSNRYIRENVRENVSWN